MLRGRFLPKLLKVSTISETFNAKLHFTGVFEEFPCQQCPAGRVFQYRVGSGRVLDKIPGIGSGSGRVGVSKYTIGYFRVSLLLSGIFGYFGYFRVISGIFGYFRVFLGISGIYGNVG